MQADEKQSLIDKIEALAPDEQKRVEGYVDALLKEKPRSFGARADLSEPGLDFRTMFTAGG